MTEYEVSWTDTARRDLTNIVEFIAEEELQAALAVLARLEHRANTLCNHPERGRLVPELRAVDIFHYRELIERPWRIVYRIEGRRVLVIALLDGRRELQSLLLQRLLE